MQSTIWKVYFRWMEQSVAVHCRQGRLRSLALLLTLTVLWLNRWLQTLDYFSEVQGCHSCPAVHSCAADFSLSRFGVAAHHFLQAHVVAVSDFWSDNKMSAPAMVTWQLQCTRVIVILTRSLLSAQYIFLFQDFCLYSNRTSLFQQQ